VGASADTSDVLYQDARWPRLARWQYGIFLYPWFLLCVVGSITTGVPWHVALALAITLPPIGVAELRLRRMGFIPRGNHIELVRALNRTCIAWDEIESFVIVLPTGRGFFDHGDRRVGTRRHRRLLPRTTYVLPTVWVSDRSEQHLAWGTSTMFGAPGLRWPGGRADDVMGFLADMLETHRPAHAA